MSAAERRTPPMMSVSQCTPLSSLSTTITTMQTMQMILKKTAQK